MADTPLHEHEAVKHLMGTEHWPTNLVRIDTEIMTGWVIAGHWRRGSDWDALAESLITLAALRGMWAKDYEIKRLVADGAYIFAVRRWSMPRAEDYKGQQYFSAPTEPLAILAAYQATVMGKESSK